MKTATMIQDKIINKVTYARKGDWVLIIREGHPLIVEHSITKERFSVTKNMIKENVR